MKFFLRTIIKIYQYGISPIMGPRCRFFPSCSEFAAEAIEKHGSLKGSKMACKRFCRCHPLSKHHGYDPVPDE